MSALPSVQQHPASVDAYIRHGFSLVPIPQGTKGPRTAGWNIKANAIKSQADLPQGWGIGLAHAYSGTMAFDIDEWDTTAMVLGLQGINLQELYDANDAVIVDSGRAGHGKLLYKMPLGMALPSKKIIINGITAYELRCATANGLTVQDVFPAGRGPAKPKISTGSKVAPKYRDPVSGQTWTGRGKAPKWIDGKERSPYLIG